MDDALNLLQWPAMVVTVAAGWLVGSDSSGRRNVGFWLFLLSNVLWVAWGWHTGALALIVLQFCLAAMNIRGAKKTKDAQATGSGDGPADAPDGADAGARPLHPTTPSSTLSP